MDLCDVTSRVKFPAAVYDEGNNKPVLTILDPCLQFGSKLLASAQLTNEHPAECSCVRRESHMTRPKFLGNEAARRRRRLPVQCPIGSCSAKCDWNGHAGTCVNPLIVTCFAGDPLSRQLCALHHGVYQLAGVLDDIRPAMHNVSGYILYI